MKLKIVCKMVAIWPDLDMSKLNNWASQASISNRIPHHTVGCDYLSMPEIPVSGIKALVWLYLDNLFFIFVLQKSKTIYNLYRWVCQVALSASEATLKHMGKWSTWIKAEWTIRQQWKKPFTENNFKIWKSLLLYKPTRERVQRVWVMQGRAIPKGGKYGHYNPNSKTKSSFPPSYLKIGGRHRSRSEQGILPR